ncbi:histone H1 [Flavobacterium sp. Sd200]|uniref:histone H1 n=1 Tax=Flavobacterium sp. Sd200 TaxID=2692211 RepID=UPI00136E379F|nr:histone H1 [Flavobacterium sp. Sd200]MXN91713.1 histone H1 [Flavobacterium sp. Sd200]
MNELNEKISAGIATYQKESEAFAQGNKAAGARARKATLELEKLFKEYRKVSIEEAKK